MFDPRDSAYAVNLTYDRHTYIQSDYTSNTVKYHESVGRIGMSAAGTSDNTLSRRVIFHGIRSIIY